MKAVGVSLSWRLTALAISLSLMLTACTAATPLPTPTNTPAPEATATPAEIVINDLSSSLCMYDSVTATEYKNSAAVYNPPSQWTLNEQKNIVDAFGIPIYQDVLNIVNGVTQTSGSKLFAASRVTRACPLSPSLIHALNLSENPHAYIAFQLHID